MRSLGRDLDARRKPPADRIGPTQPPAARTVTPPQDLEQQLRSVMSSTYYVPDGEPRTTSAGIVMVRLHQHYRGVPIFGAVRSVQLDGAGKVREVSGRAVPVREGLSVVPRLPASRAVATALEYLRTGNHRGTGRLAPARVIRELPLPGQPTVLRKRGLSEPAGASLVLFEDGPSLRPSWRLRLKQRDGGTWDLVVAADEPPRGEVVYCRSTLQCAQASGSVFTTNPGAGDRESLPFPLPLASYPLPATGLPGDFPFDWVQTDRTRGINVAAFRGNTNQAFEGKRARGEIRFAPRNDSGRDQQRLNAFYFCNWLHDFFYLLGFREQQGNFQVSNEGRGGREGDPVEARIFSKPIEIRDNDGVLHRLMASMECFADGSPPQLELGMHRDSRSRRKRHAALDADVVIHEFVHGVTTRLVGGDLTRDPLNKPQSAAMAEGYSDYFALTIQALVRPGNSVGTTFAAWASENPEGIRRHRYDDAFPGHFGLLGTPQYHDPHDAGEIWAATLILMNRRLGEALGSALAGHVLGWRLVYGSLEILDADDERPSFLDGRGAILRVFETFAEDGVIEAARTAAVEKAIRDSFLRFRMGPAAACPDASYDGISPDPP